MRFPSTLLEFQAQFPDARLGLGAGARASERRGGACVPPFPPSPIDTSAQVAQGGNLGFELFSVGDAPSMSRIDHESHRARRVGQRLIASSSRCRVSGKRSSTPPPSSVAKPRAVVTATKSPSPSVPR